MGYYADGSGYITLNPLNAKQLERVDEIFKDSIFEYDITSSQNETNIDVWCSDKYRDYWVEPCLRDLVPLGVLAGEIQFAGEDHCFWRFIYKGNRGSGQWLEQGGHIVYDE